MVLREAGVTNKNLSNKNERLSIMTATLTENKVVLFRAEIIPRLEDAVRTLDFMAATTKNAENAERLQNKANAVAKVLIEQHERLVNINTIDEGFELAAFILGVAKIDRADTAGTNLAVSYITEMLR
jgi:F420-0:gamma-glutamyl ligase